MDKMHLTGEQVQATKAALGWTQEQLAEDVGCARSQIIRYVKHGLPERMNNTVRRRLVRLASEQGVIKNAEHNEKPNHS